MSKLEIFLAQIMASPLKLNVQFSTEKGIEPIIWIGKNVATCLHLKRLKSQTST